MRIRNPDIYIIYTQTYSKHTKADIVEQNIQGLGADLVLDMKVAEDLSILEQQDEFISLLRGRKVDGKHPGPVLTSSCPGWVCYAEKTHGNWILPYISK